MFDRTDLYPNFRIRPMEPFDPARRRQVPEKHYNLDSLGDAGLDALIGGGRTERRFPERQIYAEWMRGRPLGSLDQRSHCSRRYESADQQP
jgi:hypothetical protein